MSLFPVSEKIQIYDHDPDDWHNYSIGSMISRAAILAREDRAFAPVLNKLTVLSRLFDKDWEGRGRGPTIASDLLNVVKVTQHIRKLRLFENSPAYGERLRELAEGIDSNISEYRAGLCARFNDLTPVKQYDLQQQGLGLERGVLTATVIASDWVRARNRLSEDPTPYSISTLNDFGVTQLAGFIKDFRALCYLYSLKNEQLKDTEPKFREDFFSLLKSTQLFKDKQCEPIQFGSPTGLRTTSSGEGTLQYRINPAFSLMTNCLAAAAQQDHSNIFQELLEMQKNPSLNLLQDGNALLVLLSSLEVNPSYIQAVLQSSLRINIDPISDPQDEEINFAGLHGALRAAAEKGKESTMRVIFDTLPGSLIDLAILEDLKSILKDKPDKENLFAMVESEIKSRYKVTEECIGLH